MSEDEKITQVGRLLFEKQRVAKEQAHLTEKARSLGKSLIVLGTALRDTPTAITFTNVSIDTRLNTPVVVDQVPSLDEVRTLVLAIQEQYLAGTPQKLWRDLGIEAICCTAAD